MSRVKSLLVMLCVLGVLTAIVVGPVEAAGTLWSQPWSNNWSAFVACATYDGRPADDFQLALTSDIESIAFWGGRNVDPDHAVPVVDGFQIRIFADVFDSDLGRNRADDTPIYDEYVSGNGGQTPAAGGGGAIFLYHVDLPTPVRVMAGDTYWIGIQADTKSDPNVWWGRYQSATQNLSVAEYNSSGGGYYHHPINVSPFSSGNHDFSYELTGSPVPEPSSILALVGGLGSLLAFRRRRV